MYDEKQQQLQDDFKIILRVLPSGHLFVGLDDSDPNSSIRWTLPWKPSCQKGQPLPHFGSQEVTITSPKGGLGAGFDFSKFKFGIDVKADIKQAGPLLSCSDKNPKAEGHYAVYYITLYAYLKVGFGLEGKAGTGIDASQFGLPEGTIVLGKREHTVIISCCCCPPDHVKDTETPAGVVVYSDKHVSLDHLDLKPCEDKK